MARIKERAPGGQPGAGRTERSEAFLSCPPHYKLSSPACQDLSMLLDRAVSLAEKHEAEAWRSWQLAQKHRRIKAAFEGLAKARA